MVCAPTLKKKLSFKRKNINRPNTGVTGTTVEY